jgi:hypothetical protein
MMSPTPDDTWTSFILVASLCPRRRSLQARSGRMKLQGKRAKIRFVPVNAAAQRIIEASIRSSPFPTGSGRLRHQGREGDRGQEGFQMPRRRVDDKAPDPAFAPRSA